MTKSAAPAHRISNARALLALCAAACLSPHLLHAQVVHPQIVHDGSIGHAKTLTGPNFSILAADGQSAGPNLFHSFSQFSLKAGQSASFEAPQGTLRVIARVTGPQPSTLDGNLSCNAGLYLINPSGIVFGPNATINVNGPFAAATSANVRFADGKTLPAKPTPQLVLSTAAVESFGFLKGTLSVSGSKLSAAPNSTLTLAANRLEIKGGALIEGGRILLAAGSPKESAAAEPLKSLRTPKGGRIVLEDYATVHAQGEASLLVARAGAMRIDHATFSGQSTGENGGADIDVSAGASLRLTGGSILGGTTGALPGGDVHVSAVSLLVDGADLPNVVGLLSRAEEGSSGSAGSLTVEANRMRVIAAASVSASTLGTGKGGAVTVHSSRLLIDGSHGSTATGIFSSAFAAVGSDSRGGDGGSVRIVTEGLEVLGGGQASASAFGPGKGGDLTVEAGRVLVDGRGSDKLTGIFADCGTSATGDAGKLTLKARNLSVLGGGEVQASTFGAGKGGDLTVKAGRVLVDGRGSDKLTGIFADTSSETAGAGDAGKLTLEARSLNVLGGGKVRVNTFGAGKGGDLTVEAGRVLVDGRGSDKLTGILADTSSETAGAGDAGKLTLDARNLSVLGGGELRANTFGAGKGGDLTVKAGRVLVDGRGSDKLTGILADTNFESVGAGDAGNLTLKARSLRVVGGGQVSASTLGAGMGGEVYLDTQRLLIARRGRVDALCDVGASGDARGIVVHAKTVDILTGGSLDTNTNGLGHGGDLTVIARRVRIDATDARKFTGITADSTSQDAEAGDAGDILLSSRSLSVVHGGILTASTFGSGAGGNMTVRSARVVVGPGASHSFTEIRVRTESDADSAGNAGKMRIFAGRLNVWAGGDIDAGTDGRGSGGSMFVQAGRVRIDASGDDSGYLTGLTVSTTSTKLNAGDAGDLTLRARSLSLLAGGEVAVETQGHGKGGNLTIEARSLTVIAGGNVSADTFGLGNGGDLTVEAGRVLVDGRGSSDFTGISADTNSGSVGAGDAGNLHVRSNRINLLGGASIAASTYGVGNGGDVVVRTNTLKIARDGSPDFTGVSARSADDATGAAGNVTVIARDGLSIDGGGISTLSAKGGGNVSIRSPRVSISDGALSAEAAGSAGGNGGNLTVRTGTLALGESTISANAAINNGGRIILSEQRLIQSAGSTITASGGIRGSAGSVRTSTAALDLSGALVSLTNTTLAGIGRLAEVCHMRTSEGASSFLLAPRGGIESLSGGLLPAVPTSGQSDAQDDTQPRR